MKRVVDGIGEYFNFVFFVHIIEAIQLDILLAVFVQFRYFETNNAGFASYFNLIISIGWLVGFIAIYVMLFRLAKNRPNYHKSLKQ